MGTSTSVWIVSLFCSMFNLNGSTILMNFLPWLRKQNKWKPGGDPKWNDLWIHFLVYNVLRSTETSCWVLKLLGTGRSSIGWSQGLPVRYIAGISSASLSQKPHIGLIMYLRSCALQPCRSLHYLFWRCSNLSLDNETKSGSYVQRTTNRAHKQTCCVCKKQFQ